VLPEPEDQQSHHNSEVSSLVPHRNKRIQQPVLVTPAPGNAGNAFQIVSASSLADIGSKMEEQFLGTCLYLTEDRPHPGGILVKLLERYLHVLQ
jgi:hypothetical protein